MLKTTVVPVGSHTILVVVAPGLHVPTEALRSALDETVLSEVALTDLAFIDPSQDAADAAALVVRAGAPAMRHMPFTDATKLVRDGLVVETVDRSSLTTVGLPLVIPIANVRAALSAAPADLVHVGDLVGSASVAVVAG